MLVMLATGTPTERPPIGWALAYSGYVVRHCEGWSQRLDGVPLDELPGPETLEQGDWSKDGPETKAYRKGWMSARRAQANYVKFCENPLRGVGSRTGQVERLLTRATSRK